MLLGILGAKAELLFADLRRVATVGDAEDVTILLLKGSKGELVEYEINGAAAFPEPNWYIMGDCGTLIYQDNTFRIKYFDPKKRVYYGYIQCEYCFFRWEKMGNSRYAFIDGNLPCASDRSRYHSRSKYKNRSAK